MESDDDLREPDLKKERSDLNHQDTPSYELKRSDSSKRLKHEVALGNRRHNSHENGLDDGSPRNSAGDHPLTFTVRARRTSCYLPPTSTAAPVNPVYRKPKDLGRISQAKQKFKRLSDITTPGGDARDTSERSWDREQEIRARFNGYRDVSPVREGSTVLLDQLAAAGHNEEQAFRSRSRSPNDRSPEEASATEEPARGYRANSSGDEWCGDEDWLPGKKRRSSKLLGSFAKFKRRRHRSPSPGAECGPQERDIRDDVFPANGGIDALATLALEIEQNRQTAEIEQNRADRSASHMSASTRKRSCPSNECGSSPLKAASSISSPVAAIAAKSEPKGPSQAESDSKPSSMRVNWNVPYRGVRVRKRGARTYLAEIRNPHRSCYLLLGTFKNPIEAALAYDVEACKLQGTNATCNFPEGTKVDDVLAGRVLPLGNRMDRIQEEDAVQGDEYVSCEALHHVDQQSSVTIHSKANNSKLDEVKVMIKPELLDNRVLSREADRGVQSLENVRAEGSTPKSSGGADAVPHPPSLSIISPGQSAPLLSLSKHGGHDLMGFKQESMSIKSEPPGLQEKKLDHGAIPDELRQVKPEPSIEAGLTPSLLACLTAEARANLMRSHAQRPIEPLASCLAPDNKFKYVMDAVVEHTKKAAPPEMIDLVHDGKMYDKKRPASSALSSPSAAKGSLKMQHMPRAGSFSQGTSGTSNVKQEPSVAPPPLPASGSLPGWPSSMPPPIPAAFAGLQHRSGPDLVRALAQMFNHVPGIVGPPQSLPPQTPPVVSIPSSPASARPPPLHHVETPQKTEPDRIAEFRRLAQLQQQSIHEKLNMASSNRAVMPRLGSMPPRPSPSPQAPPQQQPPPINEAFLVAQMQAARHLEAVNAVNAAKQLNDKHQLAEMLRHLAAGNAIDPARLMALAAASRATEAQQAAAGQAGVAVRPPALPVHQAALPMASPAALQAVAASGHPGFAAALEALQQKMQAEQQAQDKRQQQAQQQQQQQQQHNTALLQQAQQAQAQQNTAQQLQQQQLMATLSSLVQQQQAQQGQQAQQLASPPGLHNRFAVPTASMPPTPGVQDALPHPLAALLQHMRGVQAQQAQQAQQQGVAGPAAALPGTATLANARQQPSMPLPQGNPFFRGPIPGMPMLAGVPGQMPGATSAGLQMNSTTQSALPLLSQLLNNGQPAAAAVAAAAAAAESGGMANRVPLHVLAQLHQAANAKAHGQKPELPDDPQVKLLLMHFLMQMTGQDKTKM